LLRFRGGGGVDLVLINKAWQAQKMSFQTQPSISSFFRQLSPQEREARSVATDQKTRAQATDRCSECCTCVLATSKQKKMEIGLDL